MAVILFYTPFNNRSRDTESLMLAFLSQGHKVISLSQARGEFINEFLHTRGIQAYSHVLNGPINLLYFLKHIIYFVKFCRSNKVEIVYSHLESANFVSSIGQFFISAKVSLCRHHSDMFSFINSKHSLSYRLTYRLARRIIVVSNAAKEYMIMHEKINPDKIKVINLAYDFSLYPDIDMNFVGNLKEANPADLILITIGQLIPLKRPEESIRLLRRIIDKGINAKLFVLGKGILEPVCRELAEELDIGDRVIFKGHVQNVLDFICYADILVHPSISESSCVVVKEAGLLGKPVVVCKGVGDFDEYIVHFQNGFIVDPDKFIGEALKIILEGNKLKNFGLLENLRPEIIRLFSINAVLPLYDQLNK